MFSSDRFTLFGSPIFSALWFLLICLFRTVIEFKLQEPFLYAETSTIAHFLSFYLLCYVVTTSIVFYGRNKGLNDALTWANIIFIILPFPPIIDYFIYTEPQIYSYAPKEHFLGNLLTFFSMYGDSSWGQKILGIYVFFITGLSVFIAQKDIIRALFALLINYIYTAFVSVEWIRPLLPSGSLNNPEAIYISDSVINQGFTIYYVLISQIVVLTIWLLLHKNSLPSLIASIRPVRSLHWMLVGVLGVALSSTPLPTELIITQLIVISFSCLLGWWFIALVNDSNDLAIDKISNTKRIFIQIPQILNEKEAFFSWLAITSSLMALSLGFVPFIVMIIYLLGGIAYSVPPFRFRRYAISSSSIGTGSALFYLMGSMAYMPINSISFENINWYTVFALIFGFGMAGYIKDEKDSFSDKQAGVSTLFTIYPHNKAYKITGLLLLSGWCILLTISPNSYGFIIGCLCAIKAICLYSKKNNPLIQIFLFQLFLSSVAYSGPKLPPIPDECCHRFHFKAATDSG